MSDYTPRLLSALRSNRFGDAAELIEDQTAEIAKLRAMLDHDREASFVIELLDASHEPGQYAADAIVEYLNENYDFGDRGDTVSLCEEVNEIVRIALALRETAEITRLRKIEAAAGDYLSDRNDGTEAELLSALLAGGVFSHGGAVPDVQATLVDPSIIKDVMLEEGQ